MLCMMCVLNRVAAHLNSPNFPRIFILFLALIRRPLDTDYRCASLNEMVPRFLDRMNRVAAHLNSPNFRAHGGRGMCGLAKDLRRRCAEVVRLKGERLPK